MNNVLLFIAALLVLALSALFAAPWFIDWNDYRDVFEEQASRLIGRTVNVGGDVSLTLLPAPVLRFESVNVADENGEFDTPFISARSFTVWLAVPPLLRGAIEAHEVQLEQPVLNLKIGENGNGNWRDIGRADASMPFVPRSMALDSVKISDATVALARGSAEPYLVLEHFDGELSVRSLKGPYKFAGTFQAGNETRRLRFSTGRREKDTPLQLKALVQDEAASESYLFDGNIAGLDSVPRFKGAFRARFADAGTPAVKLPEADAEDDSAPVEIKAQVDAGLERARFGDLEITIRRSNKPQTIRGRLELSYGGDLIVESELESRWVDLDVLTGESPAGSPPRSVADVVTTLSRAALGYTSFARKGRLTVEFEQAVLAGDTLNNVKGEVTSDRTAITLDRLSASLPGENRISVRGSLTSKDTHPSFAGRLEVEGKKLNRLLSWAGYKTQTVVSAGENDFSLKGKLTAARGSLALEEATGELFGSQFSGVLRYASGERRQIELALESETLDLSAIIGPGAKPISLPALFRGEKEAHEEREAGKPFAWLGQAEARIDIDIGALTLPGLGVSEMVAGLHIVNGDIDIRKLHMKSDRGFDIQANGALNGLAESPKGNITVAAHASSPEGVVALGGLLELDAILAGDDARLERIVPMQVTASVRSMNKGKTGLTARVEGNVGASDLTGVFSLDGSIAEWAKGSVDIDAVLRNKSGREMLSQLLPHLSKDVLLRLDDSSGSLEIKAAGTPSEGMTSNAALSAAGLEWTAKGTAVSAGTGFDFTGHTDLKGPSAASLLSLAGVTMAPGRGTEAVEIKANIKKTDEVIEIKEIKGKIGQESFSGSAHLETSADKPRVKLDIVASAASLPALLEPLVAWERSGAGEPGTVRGLTRTRGFWPDQAINTKLLDALNGELALRTEKLHLTGAMVLGDGHLRAELEEGVLDIADLEGKLYGGLFKAKARLSALGSGLTFEARGQARQMRLEQITDRAGSGPLARGAVDLELSLDGAGLSPRGLAAGLNGDGKLTFGEGEIHRLAPGAPKAVVADIGKTGQQGVMKDDQLAAAVARNLTVSGFAFSPFTLPVEVRNGVARLEKVTLENPSGQATITSFMELATLKLDSEWVLAATRGEEVERPRFSLIFAGSLADFGLIRPMIDTQALKRYATIRRMERDVETLEKLKVPGANTEQKNAMTKDAAKPADTPKNQAEVQPGAVTPQAPPTTASVPEKREDVSQTGSTPVPSEKPKTAAIPVKPLPPPPLPARAPSPPSAPVRPSRPAVTMTPLPAPVRPARPAAIPAPSPAPAALQREPPPAPAVPPPSPTAPLPWLVPEAAPRTATVPPPQPPPAVAPDPAAPIPISPVPNTQASPDAGVVPDSAVPPPAPAARRRNNFRNLDLLQQDGG